MKLRVVIEKKIASVSDLEHIGSDCLRKHKNRASLVRESRVISNLLTLGPVSWASMTS